MKKYVLVAVFLITASCVWIIQDWRYGKQIAVIEKNQSDQLKKISDTALEKQQSLQDDLDDLEELWAASDAYYYKELRNAQIKTNNLRQDIAINRKRLLIRASCSTDTDQVSEAGISAGVDNGGTAELNPDARQDYFTLRDGIERVIEQLKACQARLVIPR